VPWATAVRSLGLVLDSKLLFSQHLHAVANKATGGWCNIFLLLAPDPTLAQSNKLTLYKLLIRSTPTHAAPVCRYTLPPTTSHSKFSSQNVSESSVITRGVPPLPTCTTLYTLSPSLLSSTDLQPNFLPTAPHTPTPSPTNTPADLTDKHVHVQEI